MKLASTAGYAVTALMYFSAWLRPQSRFGEKLVRWVAFEKLCLTEFLSCHAVTLLAGTAMAMEMDGGSKEFTRIYWVLLVFYFVLGSAAYLFHRDNRALIGFYAILATRAFDILSLRTPDEDMLRAVVMKNLTMFPVMMLLIAGIAFAEKPGTFLAADSGASPLDAFLRDRPGLFEKINKGRTILYAAFYYVVWAAATWLWPLRMEK